MDRPAMDQPIRAARPNEEPAGLYVHLPFCVVRCTYCDFYSLVGQDELASAYVDGVASEIQAFPGSSGYRPEIASVYIGGGTRRTSCPSCGSTRSWNRSPRRAGFG